MSNKTRTVRIGISYQEIEKADGTFETTAASFTMSRGTDKPEEAETVVEGVTDSGFDIVDETPLGLASEVLDNVRSEFVDALDIATNGEESAD